MQLSAYADLAVRLVNTATPGVEGTDRLTCTAEVLALMTGQHRWAERTGGRDVETLRRLRGRLREVFDHAADGRADEAVECLNALLEESLVRPQISGHDGESWHLHLSSENEAAGVAFASAAVVGLAVAVTEVGAHRLGTCASPPCRNAYLDTTTNGSRRYCGERCASRANVAAHRARRRGTERNEGTKRTERRDEPGGGQ